MIPHDHVHVRLAIEDPSLIMELKEYFSFYVPNHKWHPKVRKKLWDGKISFFDIRSHLLYIGLIPDLISFCKERHYRLIPIEGKENLLNTFIDIHDDRPSEYDVKILDEMIPKKFPPRDYQMNSVIEIIKRRKTIIQSATGSGKSFVIYLAALWYYHHTQGEKKILIVVPTTTLVSQMKTDILDYANGDEMIDESFIHEIYSGKEKHDISAPIIVSTFQSITKLPKEWYRDIGMLVIDECHRSTAISIKNIAEKASNAEYRIGTTGTLPERDKNGERANEITIKGIFGSVYKASSTSELQKKHELADLKIECIVLEHQGVDEKTLYGDGKLQGQVKYQNEVNYIIGHEKRNHFITDLAIAQANDQKRNVLILFHNIDKHGKILFQMINDKNFDPTKVHYISGETPTDEREIIRQNVDHESNGGHIITASSATFATGINIKNLHSIIFAVSFKSQIRVIQSIGRGLRLSDDGRETLLFDICDDLFPQRKSIANKNYFMKHAKERLSYYTNEQFKYKIRQINNF